ncbi:patatin-like phospholipase family protein [Archangium sp.]|uniref:patatin-like phospholipase family protein n=1 Tax=Archangium sp. TaxID=1872627 RepID=UPI002EDB93B2
MSGSPLPAPTVMGAGASSATAPAPHLAELGLALSGGGSRAAAFHRGTLQGLMELGLLPGVEVVSTVSGGSIFAAAWMAAKANAEQEERFLANMKVELCKGFVLRSLNPLQLAKLLLPRHTRTNVLAETFDRLFFRGLNLKQLPEHPRLCINTTVLNHAQVGKFSREGFATADVFADDTHRRRTVPLPDFPLKLAATASAAFPIGLPPLFLSRKRDLGNAAFAERLHSHRTLALSDGGLLENLGVQTLLKSRRFGAWNLIISDAGTQESTWTPGDLVDPVKAFLMVLFSAPHLVRISTLMNSKQNRSMRELTLRELEISWMASRMREGSTETPLDEGMRAFLADRHMRPRRKLLFLRVNQDLETLLTLLPRWRWCELWQAAHPGQRVPPTPKEPEALQERLASLGVDLGKAVELYKTLGGRDRARQLNTIGTHFQKLSPEEVDGLAQHARWQVHATRALFW